MFSRLIKDNMWLIVMFSVALGYYGAWTQFQFDPLGLFNKAPAPSTTQYIEKIGTGAKTFDIKLQPGTVDLIFECPALASAVTCDVKITSTDATVVLFGNNTEGERARIKVRQETTYHVVIADTLQTWTLVAGDSESVKAKGE